MARFTSHAYKRFQSRHLTLVPTQIAASAQNGADPIVRRAHESFFRGHLITREEAAARINGPIYPGSGDYFFRTDGIGRGVWVVRMVKRQEVVVTYLPVRPMRTQRGFRGKLASLRLRSHQ